MNQSSRGLKMAFKVVMTFGKTCVRDRKLTGAPFIEFLSGKDIEPFKWREPERKRTYYYPENYQKFIEDMRAKGFEDWEIIIATEVIRSFSSFYGDLRPKKGGDKE